MKIKMIYDLDKRPLYVNQLFLPFYSGRMDPHILRDDGLFQTILSYFQGTASQWEDLGYLRKQLEVVLEEGSEAIEGFREALFDRWEEAGIRFQGSWQQEAEAMKALARRYAPDPDPVYTRLLLICLMWGKPLDQIVDDPETLGKLWSEGIPAVDIARQNRFDMVWPEQETRKRVLKVLYNDTHRALPFFVTAAQTGQSRELVLQAGACCLAEFAGEELRSLRPPLARFRSREAALSWDGEKQTLKLSVCRREKDGSAVPLAGMLPRDVCTMAYGPEGELLTISGGRIRGLEDMDPELRLPGLLREARNRQFIQLYQGGAVLGAMTDAGLLYTGAGTYTLQGQDWCYAAAVAEATQGLWVLTAGPQGLKVLGSGCLTPEEFFTKLTDPWAKEGE